MNTLLTCKEVIYVQMSGKMVLKRLDHFMIVIRYACL